MQRNLDKRNKSDELSIANTELAFQQEEKEKRAAELIIANIELNFQNTEKGKRAAELVVANKELSFQNAEKEKRAAELIIANVELSFQNAEKEKRTAELIIANKELKNAEDELRITHERLLFHIENTPLGFIEWDNQLHIKSLSKRSEEIFGWSFKEFVQREKTGFTHVYEADLTKVSTIAEQLISGEVERNNVQHRNITKNGRVIWCEWFNSVLKDKEGNVITIMSLVQDITVQKETEDKIKKANQLSVFITMVNQNIVHVKDEKTLFKNSCRTATKFGKFKLAWICTFDADCKKVTIVEHSGIPTVEFKVFPDTSNQADFALHHILQTGTHYVCNNIENAPELEKWKPFTTEEKIRSLMILPIWKSGNIIGVFNLCSTELNFFDKEEIALLIEVTRDISFALDMFDNTTKQKRTEELIIKNEQRFRALIEKSADMKTLSTSKGKLTYGSPSIMKVLAYSLEEFQHPPLIFDFIHPEDIQDFIEKREKILQIPGSSFYCQQRLLHKNGTWVWCEGNVTNLLHEPGVHALVSNFRDISAKKTAELQQEFDRNNLNALINNTNDLMWSVNKDFNLITSNQPFDDMIRLMSGKTIKRGSNILSTGFPEEQLKRHKLFYERAFAGETFTEIEYTAFPSEFWSEISYYPVRKGNEVIGTACHSRNITERKLAEIERVKIIDDLIQRNKDLQQFSYIVSHNLRAPVANIIGLSAAVKDGNLNLDQKVKVMEGLAQSVKNLDNVIIDLNNILRIKREVAQMKEVVCFSKITKDIHSSIKNLIAKEKAVVIWDFSQVDEMLTIKSYMHSIFFNLVSNSLKYRQSNLSPVIEIKSYKLQNKIKLLFKDNGIGIDLKTKGDQVFGLYKRFHPESCEGKGMGLYMVKTQVESLGGKIGIESEINKGSIITIEFEA